MVLGSPLLLYSLDRSVLAGDIQEKSGHQLLVGSSLVSVLLVGSLCDLGMFGPKLSWFCMLCGPSILGLLQNRLKLWIFMRLSKLLCMRVWSSANSDSPKLVEIISDKLLHLVWCLLFHYSLQELTVKYDT